MLLRIFVILVLAASIFCGGWFVTHKLYFAPKQRLLADQILPAPTPPPDPSLADFDRCVEVRRTRPMSEARLALEQFLREFPATTKRDEALDILGEINASEFFSAKPTDASAYIVKSGDTISGVARRTNLPMELLVHLNRLGRGFLHPNQRLLAPKCSFRMVIQQKSRRIVLYNGDKFFRQYPPLAWPRGDRKEDILPRQSGQVVEKRAVDDSGSVTAEDPHYYNARHMIRVSVPGFSLYTLPDDPKIIAQRPPGGGIGMAAKHMSEISVLLPANAPVSIE